MHFYGLSLSNSVAKRLKCVQVISPGAMKHNGSHNHSLDKVIHFVKQGESFSAVHACCTLSNLSATVGSLDKFNEWLAMVQKARGFNHKFVYHPYHYSHSRKFFYNIYEKTKNKFESLTMHQSTGRARFLHPIAMLAFGAKSIPPDMALEASDTLSLFRALKTDGGLSPSILEKLEPSKFFLLTRFLQQKDVIRYDEALETHLGHILASFDPYDRNAHLSRVIPRYLTFPLTSSMHPRPRDV